MPIVLDEATLIEETAAVTLARYIQIINYPSPCAFWGVSRTGEQQSGCKNIFLKADRDMIIRALQEAQEEIENEVDFALSPRWFTDEKHVFGPRQPAIRATRWQLCPRIVTDWGYVIAGGVRAVTVIEAGAAVDQTSDPAVITVVAAAVADIADVSEVHIYHPGTDVEIDPSAVEIDTGTNTLTITVPRCRTVAAAYAENPKLGWPYDDDTYFEATVDVKRVYNDPSTNAELVWPHQCSADCSSAGCAEYTQTGCMYTELNKVGTVSVERATYSSGAWRAGGSGAGLCRGVPEYVRLNYYAGLNPVSRQVEDAVVRLAHSKMPDEPCGCAVLQQHWKRDRTVPAVLTREILNNPFGYSLGALFAYHQAQSIKIWKAAVL
jgi:hypothetical protein